MVSEEIKKAVQVLRENNVKPVIIDGKEHYFFAKSKDERGNIEWEVVEC